MNSKSKEKIIAYNKAKFNFKSFRTVAIYNGPINSIKWTPKTAVDVLLLPINQLTGKAINSKNVNKNINITNSPSNGSSPLLKPYQSPKSSIINNTNSQYSGSPFLTNSPYSGSPFLTNSPFLANSPNPNSPYTNSPILFESDKSTYSGNNLNVNELDIYKRQSDNFIFKGVKMILGTIDMTSFMKKYNKPASLAKFIKHSMRKIVKDVLIKPDGITLLGFPELRHQFSVDECAEFFSLVRNIFKDIVIMADIDYINIFEKVRDQVDGIFLKNFIFYCDGNQKTRHDASAPNTAKYLADLKNEINTRADFMVLDFEVLPPFDGNHKEYIIIHRIIKWLNGYGFLGNICHSLDLSNPKDVKPIMYLCVGDDNVFEFVNANVIKETLACIEKLTLKVDWNVDDITPEIWAKVLVEVNFPPDIQCRFNHILNIKKEHIKATVYTKPVPPKVPMLAELQKSPILKEFEETLIRPPRSLSTRDSMATASTSASSVQVSASKRIYHSVSYKAQQKMKLNKSNSISANGGAGNGQANTEKKYTLKRATGMNYIGQDYDEKRNNEVNKSVAKVLLNLYTKNLLGTVRTSIDVPSNEYTPAFRHILDTLAKIIKEPSRSVKYLKEYVLQGLDVKTLIQSLRSDLISKQVEVLTVTSVALRLKEENPLPYKPIIAIGSETEQNPGILYIFVDERVPNLLEAIIHIYCKHAYNLTQQQCIAMEALVVAQEQTKAQLPMSSRLIWQLGNMDISEKIDLVRRTHSVVKRIKEKKINIQNRYEMLYFIEIAKYVKQYCNYILIKKQNYEDKLIEATYEAFAPINMFEEELAQFVGWSTLDPKGQDRLINYCFCLKDVINRKVFPEDSVYSECLCYLFYAFWKACRRIAWMNLFSSLLDINSLFLPESDQIAVGMEMTTTQANMNFLYDLNSHQLSKAMHKLLRIRGKKVPKEAYEEQMNQSAIQSEHTAKTIANAFLFVYPVLVDLLLIKFVGSGIFLTKNMNTEARECVSYIFLFIFPIVGGLINSIARTCTYYFFCKSMPVMLEAFTRRLSLALLLVVAISFVMAIIFFFCFHYDVIILVLSFFYCTGFCLYMCFFSILASIKNPNLLFLKSKGPRSAMLGVSILLIPTLLAIFVFNDEKYSNINWTLYVVGLFVSVLFMLKMYSQIAHEYMDWPNSITIPTEEDIQKFFETTHPKPQPFPEEEVEIYEKRLLQWNRSAREHYMKTVSDSVRSSVFKSQPQIIKQRVEQQRWEKELMEWYTIRTGTIIPPEKYSNQWDTMVKGGIIELKKKYQIEKMNRGDLLFAFEKTSIYFGFFYFIFIFLDKWAMLFLTGRPMIYVENGLNDDFINATLFGTLFMLLTSGFLEMTLSSILKYQNKPEIQVRLGKSNKAKDMFMSFKRKSRRIYRRELIKFLVIMLLVMLGISFIYLYFYCKKRESLYIYAFSILGFCGFLLGLFHKLFFQSQESENILNKYIVYIIIICVGTPALLAYFFGLQWFVAISTSAGGWLFGITCIVLYFRETYSNVHYTTTLSPHLASSGQRYIDENYDSLANKTLSTFTEMKAPRHKLLIDPQSQSIIISKMNYYYEQFNYLPENHILRIAFPNGRQILSNIIHNLMNGKIEVYILPEQMFSIGGHQYTAISRFNEKGVLEVFTFELQALGVVTDIISEEVCQWICTSIVHEFAENVLGYSHGEACICEYLAYNFGKMSNTVPNRIVYQLQNSTNNELRRISYNTENITLRKGLFNINIDREWTRLSRESRVWLIRWISDLDKVMTEFNPLECTFNIAKIKTFLNNIPNNLMAAIHTYNNSSISIKEVVAESITAIFLSQLINNQISIIYETSYSQIQMNRNNRNTSKKKNRYSFVVSIKTLQPFKAKDGSTLMNTTMRHSQRGEESKKPSIFERLVLRIEEYQLLLYLALTGDSRFGREMSSIKTMFLFDILLSFIYTISRKIGWTIIKDLYLSHKTETITLMKQMKDGLFRQHYVNGKKIQRVDSYLSGLETVVSIMKYDKGLIIADRYKGPKVLGWVPSEKDKPFSRGYFSAKNKQLLYEHELDNNEKVLRTKVYLYQNEKIAFPYEAYYVEGNINPSAKNYQKNITLLKERIFYDKEIHHRISNVILRITQEKTGEKIDVNATYIYEKNNSSNSNSSIHHIPKYASYKCVQLNWSMVTFYATGFKIDNHNSTEAPKFSRIEFRNLDRPNVVFITTFDYSHPQNTRSNTIEYNEKTHAYRQIQTPYEVANDPLKILLRAPPPSFYDNNEIITVNLNSKKSFFSHKKVRCISYFTTKFSTSYRRRELWTFWRANKIEGTFARDFDEHLLREEPILSDYWKHRDKGHKEKAVECLLKNKLILDVILVVTDRPTTRSNLHLKFSDLEILGMGGDGTEVGRPSELKQESNILSVMNLDSGTWPTGGGGVGSCRRDLIDYLEHIRWHALVEIGSAEAVQRDYQIERNIASITYLPLWDVDFSSPDENIYRKLDYRVLRSKKMHTKDDIIGKIFTPIIYQLVYACLDDDLSNEKITEYEELFVDLYLYFQKCDWVISWNHISTQRTWIVAWLECTEQKLREGKLIDIEMPTLKEIDMLFSLITRLLFPISAKIDEVPVVHASHHGIQAILGVIAKAINKSTLVIWDHGILWRERLFGLCSSDDMPRFVQMGFVGLTRLVSRLVYARADYITPCTSIQNVAWEQWIGGGKYGDDAERQRVARNTYPVVNGMNVARFNTKPELENPDPLAVMLSHISPVKDIHNAVNAASVIVNELHITNYKLHIYGSKEKDATYAAQTQNLITALNLSNHVVLKGLGNPSNVLPSGWVFVNSSITEGLPLALGEAGLCGLPVVCTDVGGSREVISNLDTGTVFGSIVPPQKSRQLALGQLKVLAMTDGLEQLIDPDAPYVKLDDLLEKGPKAVEDRMCDQNIKEKRRKLGLLLREKTINTFSIAKYWRQHEQILWLGHLYNTIKKN